MNNLRNLFKKNNNSKTISNQSADFKQSLIICDSKNLRNFIKTWMHHTHWAFEDFAVFAELIGAKTPVKLSDFNSSNNSFTCVSSIGKKLGITLHFGDWIDTSSSIHVTEGNEVKIFEINTGWNETPEVSLTGRIVTQGSKKLSCHYDNYSCRRYLNLDDIHSLEIKFSEPETSNDNSEHIILRNHMTVEDYLLSLDTNLVVSEVYEKLVKFMHLSKQDIDSCQSIFIKYKENCKAGKPLVLSTISLKYGKMQEYAVLENGETFHVFEDGSWSYLSDCLKISFSINSGHYTFSIESRKLYTPITDADQVIAYAKEKISELWKYVE